MANRRQRQTGKEKTSPCVPPETDCNVAEQFELEVKWCIEQLEEVLSSSKTSNKQAQDASRSLSVLRNKNAPMVKKRQAMRNSCGDYRTKMTEEEKKFSKAQEKIHIAALSPSKKSCFVKKRSTYESAAEVTSGSENGFIYKRSNNDFKFNFVNCT